MRGNNNNNNNNNTSDLQSDSSEHTRNISRSLSESSLPSVIRPVHESTPLRGLSPVNSKKTYKKKKTKHDELMDLMERVRRSCEDALINTLTGKQHISHKAEENIGKQFNKFNEELDKFKDRLTDQSNNVENYERELYDRNIQQSPNISSNYISTPSSSHSSTSNVSQSLDTSRVSNDDRMKAFKKRLLSSSSDRSYEPLKRVRRLSATLSKQLSPISEMDEDVGEINQSRKIQKRKLDDTVDSVIERKKKIIGRKKRLPEGFLDETQKSDDHPVADSSKILTDESRDIASPEDISYIEKRGKRRKIVKKKRKLDDLNSTSNNSEYISYIAERGKRRKIIKKKKKKIRWKSIFKFRR
jgi:hypothetical protein